MRPLALLRRRTRGRPFPFSIPLLDVCAWGGSGGMEDIVLQGHSTAMDARSDNQAGSTRSVRLDVFLRTEPAAMMRVLWSHSLHRRIVHRRMIR